MSTITQRVKRILSEIPSGVKIVAAAKTREIYEVKEAMDAGINLIGENYLQESTAMIEGLPGRAEWHFIGHAQKNKVRHIVPIFDMIETVDSEKLARIIDTQAKNHGKIMPILIEINIAKEEQKAGVIPEEAEALIARISEMENIEVQGLMTMGPLLEDPADLRPYFKETRSLFDQLKNAGHNMRHLSMGMSDSYITAIEEGATMVRIGTVIFGPRKCTRV
jgi:pyridoxal phosphate enzyme (YggS family)